MNRGLLDPIPIGIVFILFIVVSFVCFEIGFRVGVWWQAREPGEQEGPTDLLVGSLLGLMALRPCDHHGPRGGSTRRAARTGRGGGERDRHGIPASRLPPEGGRRAAQGAAPSVSTASDRRGPDAVPANIVKSAALAQQMWTIEARVAQTGYFPDLMSSLGDSLNADRHGRVSSAIVAGVYTRVPETITFLLLAGSALSLAMVGYSAGLKGRRSVLTRGRAHRRHRRRHDPGGRPRPPPGGVR